jgi:RNA polymerase sigma-70 factor (ECF subfamily)
MRDIAVGRTTQALAEQTGVVADSTASALGFDQVFRAEYPKLVRLLTVTCTDGDVAADLAQDAFVQLHRHWDDVSGYDDPSAWLRRVALNRAANHRRGRARRSSFLRRSGREVAPGGTEDTVADVDLWRALAGLTPRQRAVVALHHLDDRPVAEVADLLGLAPGTVKSHLHDARRALARNPHLDREDDDEPRL